MKRNRPSRLCIFAGRLTPMPKNLVKLKKREAVANGTMAFHFDKPAGFEFKAGQFLELALLNPPETDAEGNARAFSIASAPSEPDLFVATRMRDTAFQRVLKTMPLGTEIEIDGPLATLFCTTGSNAPRSFWLEESASRRSAVSCFGPRRR